MPEYNFHIHGKPYSQDIWKNDKYHDYLNGMYTDQYLNASSDESYLIIEILDNTVHYTYMLSKGVRDSLGRAGSFFAMTVSLKGQCCSVIALYNLLDQIYNKFAKPSFFNYDGKNLQYKVQHLEDAKVANTSVVDQIKTAFDNNVMHLDLKNLDHSKDTIHSSETKVFSIMDVDSPEFLSELKKYRIVVSSLADSAIKRCGKIEAEYTIVRDQNNLLTTQNNQLNSQILSLKQENELLSSQLHSSASTAEKKYKDTINQLKRDVENISRERDSLKRKIDEATSSVELIEKPIQKLTRLLAGRFPKNDKEPFDEDMESSPKSDSKDSKGTRISRLNSILLGIIIFLCFVILYFVALKPNIVDNTPKDSEEPADSEVSIYSGEADYGTEYGEIPAESEPESGETTIKYDDWESCLINIVGGGNQIKNGKTYTLKVQKSDYSVATVPQGSWSVWINSPNELINDDNTFVLPEGTALETNVRIEYIVDGKTVLSRTSKVI